MSPSAAASRLYGVSVLIPDDAPQILTTVRAILERYGATVTAVGSADDARQALQRERPNVLLSDLSMPGKGGYRLTPAAALTAYVGEPHRTSVLRAGFQCHVEKAVRVAELIDVVSRLTTNARSTELDAKSMRGPPAGPTGSGTSFKTSWPSSSRGPPSLASNCSGPPLGSSGRGTSSRPSWAWSSMFRRAASSPPVTRARRLLQLRGTQTRRGHGQRSA